MLQEKHGDLLKTYNEKWNLVKDLIGKDFDVEVFHGDKHAPARMKPAKMKLKLISSKTDYRQEKLNI